MLDSVNRRNFFIARYNSDGSPDKTLDFSRNIINNQLIFVAVFTNNMFIDKGTVTPMFRISFMVKWHIHVIKNTIILLVEGCQVCIL